MNDNRDTSLAGNPVWIRIIGMLVLGIAYAVAQTVLVALVAGQVLFMIFAKKQTEPLRSMGKQVSDYIHQILIFLTFNSEYRPFPYREWGEKRDTPVIAPSNKPTEQN